MKTKFNNMKTNVGAIQMVKKCEISISLENEEEVKAFIHILNEAREYFEEFRPNETMCYLLEFLIIDEIEKQIKQKFSEL